MGETTEISWTDHTFNPWVGCTKVSVGDKGACEGCYAEAMMADRYGRVVWGRAGQAATYSRTGASYWKQPLAWDRKAARDGVRRFVFCASLADVFDNQVDPAWRRDLFALIRATPNLVWLLLTKRPQNIVKLFAETRRRVDDDWPRNAAMMCTVVTQVEAERDLPWLQRAKAVLKPAFVGVSMEPLMEAVDIRRWLICAGCDDGRPVTDAVVAHCQNPRLDWVIAGGETDQGAHKARPVRVEWIRSLRDQCSAAGVPFHFKQWGSWHADALAYTDMQGRCPPPNMKIGHKRAGRLLDGIQHDARPVTP